jgi:N-methylhydantoinase A
MAYPTNGRASDSRSDSTGRFRLGIDVGGTFTDLALREERTGRLTVVKVLSTTPNPAEGVLAGFRMLLERAGGRAERIDYLAHASTVASNLVIERRGHRIALITTQGFRDVLYLQRQKRADLHDVFYDKPMPLVRRRDIYEVPERVAADGQVLQAIDEVAIREVLAAITAKGIDSVAVVFLHSYAYPAHEQRVGAIAAARFPALQLSLSSEVSPKWREYERTSTTVMNAYVMPPVAHYLESMALMLADEGIGAPLHVMQCSGGLVRVEGMKRTPVALVESGPAAGALMAGVVGQACGRNRVIAFDMGGTTAKVSIVENGEPHIVEDFEVATVTKVGPGSGLPVAIPAVDLVEIGTGGGSIAHLDVGVLRVGPQSAGASPGPACYGFGGQSPTVTDADLLLGYLDPDRFLGGDLALDSKAATAAIKDGVATPLELTVEEAAHAIRTVANSSMANAMRIVTVQKGLDPREFTIIAFGGAGPLHVVAIAEEIGVLEIIVPPGAGIGSAVGLLVARVKFELSRTVLIRLEQGALPRLRTVFASLEERGRRSLRESAADVGCQVLRQVGMRYAGQGYQVFVEMPEDDGSPAAVETLRDGFLDRYRRIYGYSERRGALEIVDCRLTALGPPPEALPRGLAVEEPPGAPRTRRIYDPALGGHVDVPAVDRVDLRVGSEIHGPALVQEREATTLIPPGWSGRVDNLGNLILSTLGTT